MVIPPKILAIFSHHLQTLFGIRVKSFKPPPKKLVKSKGGQLSPHIPSLRIISQKRELPVIKVRICMEEGILFPFLSPWGPPPHLCRQAFDERRQRTIDDTLDWENSVVVVISFVTPIFNIGDWSGDWLWDSWRHFFMQIHKLWQKSHRWSIANAMVFLTVLWRMLTGWLVTNRDSYNMMLNFCKVTDSICLLN